MELWGRVLIQALLQSVDNALIRESPHQNIDVSLLAGSDLVDIRGPQRRIVTVTGEQQQILLSGGEGIESR